VSRFTTKPQQTTPIQWAVATSQLGGTLVPQRDGRGVMRLGRFLLCRDLAQHQGHASRYAWAMSTRQSTRSVIVFRSRALHRNAQYGMAFMGTTVVVAGIAILVAGSTTTAAAAWCIFAVTSWWWSFPWRGPLGERLEASDDGLMSRDGDSSRLLRWSEIDEILDRDPMSATGRHSRACARLENGVFVRLAGLIRPRLGQARGVPRRSRRSQNCAGWLCECERAAVCRHRIRCQ
jgi:hypothetical protein